MRRLLLALSPANLIFEFGSGRALDNARREHEEAAETMAMIAALARRLRPEPPTAVAPAVPATVVVEHRVAA